MARIGTERRFRNMKLLAKELTVDGQSVYNPNYGRNWFVDAKNGSNSNGGTSWDGPFLTMTYALTQVDSGDRIYFVGKVKEQCTTPAGVFDVSIVGAANRPRHADDHSESSTPGRGSSASSWLSPDSATASTPLLKVQQQGWRVHNVLWGAGPANTASLQAFRDGGSGDDERDGSHLHVSNCRFSAPVIGIQASGGPAFLFIEDCMFHGATTKAIGETTGAGIGTNLLWTIRNNIFQDNASAIVAPLSQGNIIGNTMGKFTTSSIDLNGGAGYNQVHGNYLSGSYITDAAQYRAASNDDWSGNFSSDEDESTVTSGITHAVPTTD